MNANKVLQLKHAVIMLQHIAQFSRELSRDQTSMPDGSGTVAGVYALAVADMEIPYLQLLETVPAEVLKAIMEKAAKPASAVLAASPALPANMPVNVPHGTPGRRVAGMMQMERVGDFFICPDPDDARRGYVYVFLPGDTSWRSIPYCTTNETGCWTLSGTEDRPTLSPSINAFDSAKKSIYHGYLRDGAFTPDLNQPSNPATDTAKVAPGTVQDAGPAPVAAEYGAAKPAFNPEPHAIRRAYDAPGLMR